MSAWWFDSLGMVVSPWQLAIAAGVAVLLFAPQLMGPIGRMLGKLARMEVRRRTGIKLPGNRPAASAPRTASPPQRMEVEILPPESSFPPRQPGPTATSTVPPPMRQTVDAPARRSAGAPLWAVAAIVGTLIVMLLWWLLHQR